MYKDLNDALKELGDVKNWAQVIEKDMNAVTDALEDIINHRAGQSAGGDDEGQSADNDLLNG